MFQHDLNKSIHLPLILGALLAGLAGCGSDAQGANTVTGTGGIDGIGTASGGAYGTITSSTGGMSPGAGLPNTSNGGAPALGTGGTFVGAGGVVGMAGGGAGLGGMVATGGAGVGGVAGAGMGGMGGGAGAAGMANTGGAAGAGGAPMHADLGMGNGSDVVLLGDSWMSNTLQIEGTGGGIAPSLLTLTHQPYKNYAVQGVMLLMADGFGPAIPTQWPTAKAASPSGVKTVIMTGGGNDIIQNATIQTACQMGADSCTQLFAQLSDALNMLWTQMAMDGVQDIVYVQYSKDVGTVDPKIRAAQPVPAICSTDKVRCHYVDTTDALMKQIAADGIHPLAAANDRIAKQIFDLMVAQGIRR